MRPLEDYVVRAASEAQWLETHDRLFASWGAGLTREEFEERETAICRTSRFGQQSFHAWYTHLPWDSE